MTRTLAIIPGGAWDHAARRRFSDLWDSAALRRPEPEGESDADLGDLGDLRPVRGGAGGADRVDGEDKEMQR